MYRGLVPSRTSETFEGCKQNEHAGLREEAAAELPAHTCSGMAPHCWPVLSCVSGQSSSAETTLI